MLCLPGTMQRTENLHELDMEYQTCSHQTELVVKDEGARRLQLRNVLLQDENTSLQERIGQNNIRIGQLSAQYDDARLQLDNASEKHKEQEEPAAGPCSRGG